MAEKVTGGEAKPAKRPPKTHNLPELVKALSPFMKDIMGAYDEMEEDHGSHVLTISNKFDAIAEKIGYPKALIRSQVAKIRRESKEADAIKEMDQAELEQEIELAKAFAGTGFGKFAEARLAKLQAAAGK